MSYSVEFTDKAKKAMRHLDPQQNRILISWIKKNLQNCEDPRLHGKPLAGNKRGYWRYRIGSYRLIADIKDDVLCILFINIGHRKDIYQ